MPLWRDVCTYPLTVNIENPNDYITHTRTVVRLFHPHLRRTLVDIMVSNCLHVIAPRLFEVPEILGSIATREVGDEQEDSVETVVNTEFYDISHRPAAVVAYSATVVGNVDLIAELF